MNREMEKERDYGGLSPHFDRNAVRLSANSEDLGAALGALALGGWLAVLHCDLLGVFHVNFFPALYAICLYHCICLLRRG